MSTTELSPLAQALGSVPTGLYIVATAHDGERLGFVGSFVMQHGFEPPTVSVAIGRDREHLAAVRAAGRFSLTILDASGSGLMKPFFQKYEAGESAFDQQETETTPGGMPVLAGGLAWIECEVSGEHDAGDHVVVFGRVTEGAKVRDGSPSIHLRKNGLGY